MLERVVELLDRDAGVALEPDQQAGIDAARARGHYEALERREAHRRVDRAPARDRAQRRARAEVARDDSQLLQRPSQLRGRLARHVAVVQAVEAVAAQLVALDPLPGKRVRPRRVRQRRVKRRVETRDYRLLGAEAPN